MANDPTSKRLLQALAHHENAAETLRRALALLNAAPRAKYERKNGQNGHLPAMFKEAIALDATRRAVTKAKHKKGPKNTAEKLAQRQKTADALAKFDLRTPRDAKEVPAIEQRLGPMVRRGYLAKKGTGYVRTGKVYHVDPNGPA